MEPTCTADRRRLGEDASRGRAPSPRWRRRGETRTKTSPPRGCCCRRCSGPCPRIQCAADATEAADDEADAKVAAKAARAARASAARACAAPSARRCPRRRASGGSGPCRAPRWTSRRRRGGGGGRARENGSPPRRQRVQRQSEAAAARAAALGWTPGVGEDVVVTATGMCGKVTAVSGALVTVQAGLMGMKVNASDLMPDPNAAARAEAARPPAKARLPRGAQAARRVDALLGGGPRVAASRNELRFRSLRGLRGLRGRGRLLSHSGRHGPHQEDGRRRRRRGQRRRRPLRAERAEHAQVARRGFRLAAAGAGRRQRRQEEAEEAEEEGERVAFQRREVRDAEAVLRRVEAGCALGVGGRQRA